jgi:hypothetical protein
VNLKETYLDIDALREIGFLSINSEIFALAGNYSDRE